MSRGRAPVAHPLRLLILGTALVASACQGSSPGEQDTAAGQPCSSEAVQDGRSLYHDVYRVEPITEEPKGKPIVPKKVVGAKLYLTPRAKMSAAYLVHAARCYAKSNDIASASGHDPLRAGGSLKIRVTRAGGTWVLSIRGASSETGDEIFAQSNALVASRPPGKTP
ncbi:MAG: hypothetical protein AAF500_06780 [Myxococcota bacterium]